MQAFWHWPVERPFFKGIPFSRVPLSKGRWVVEGCGSAFSRGAVPFFKPFFKGVVPGVSKKTWVEGL